MTWLIPWALGAAALAAAGVTLLHLLARDRPQRWLLPTARFVAPGTARATRRARTPRDLLLLALRVMALVLAGAAFAGPMVHPDGASVARVIVLTSAHGPAARAALDSARVRVVDGDRLVLLDSMATQVAPGHELAALDSLAARLADSTTMRARTGDVSLSAGIIAAVRAAAALDASVDSVTLAIIAPGARADAALQETRKLWPGRADVVVVAGDSAPPGSDTSSGGSVLVRGMPADAVVAAARLAGARIQASRAESRAESPEPSTAVATLLVRTLPTTADSAFARSGGTLVVWPDDSAGMSTMLVRAGSRDTASGFVAGGNAVLYRTTRTHVPPEGHAVARWIDGAPAITEAPLGHGCMRTAAVAIPAAGDLTLRPAFQAALRTLLTPCDAAAAQTMTDSVRALLAGSGALARAGTLRAGATHSPASPWLLGAALILLLVEPLMRRASPAPARADA